jgi:hypothetical protein
MPTGWTLVTTAAQADVEPFLNEGVTVVNLPVTSR